MKKFLLAFLLITFSLHAECCFFGEIEYLFWNISQTNMPYAVAVEDPTSFTNFEEIKQEDHWTSGFRLSLGTQICCNFTTKLAWTRLHSTFNDNETNKILIASQLLAPNLNFVSGGPAFSQWDFAFDTIDWDFGMPFCCTEVFYLFPFVGLKGCIIRQQQQITYENFSNGGVPLNALITENNNFYGAGPKVGISLNYLLSSRWTFEGLLASSLICGKQISPSLTTFTQTVSPFSYSSKFTTNNMRIIPFIQTYLGLSWQRCICNFPILLGVGYEAQFFWDMWRTQNSIIQQVYITDASYGALMLQGLTAKLQVTF